jgi:hypothetical protein
VLIGRFAPDPDADATRQSPPAGRSRSSPAVLLQRPRQTELRKDTAVGEPRNRRDAVALESQHEHRKRTGPKYVVSSTLDHPRWSNATVLRGEVVEEVSKLKQELDGEIVVYASYELGRTLIEQDLVDELRLSVSRWCSGLASACSERPATGSPCASATPRRSVTASPSSPTSSSARPSGEQTGTPALMTNRPPLVQRAVRTSCEAGVASDASYGLAWKKTSQPLISTSPLLSRCSPSTAKMTSSRACSFFLPERITTF